MSIEKSEIRSQLAHDLGCRVDDLLEKAESQEHFHSGKQTAFKMCHAQVQGLMSLVTQDLDSGKFSNLSALEVSALLKRQLTVLSTKIKALGENSINSHLQAQGEQVGLKNAVKLLQDSYEREQRLIEKLKAREEAQEKAAAEALAQSEVEAAAAPPEDPKPKKAKPTKAKAKARATKAKKPSKAKKATPKAKKPRGKIVTSASDLSSDTDTILYIDTETGSLTEMPDPALRAVGTHPGAGLSATRKKRSKRAPAKK